MIDKYIDGLLPFFLILYISLGIYIITCTYYYFWPTQDNKSRSQYSKKKELNIALFIDADNAPASKFVYVYDELKKQGNLTVRRAYGNWRKLILQAWEKHLHEYAIQPIQQFDLTKGKNATDMALVIDAMDVLQTKKIDIMCFMTSDSDFTPMAMKARREGKIVLGFGESKTPVAFSRACSQFINLDKFGTDSVDLKMRMLNKNSPTRAYLVQLIMQAIKSTMKEDSSWASLGSVGQYLYKFNNFNTKVYGFKNLSNLIESTQEFDMRFETGDKSNVLIRVKNT